MKSPPPALDEIEVSVFGPGYGESVLIHPGGGNWLIIDSCLDSSSGQPAPLRYLKSLGVEPSKSVSQIVATHWHDDHIRGLAQIFRECRSAEFVCSEALRNNEFLTLVEAHSSRFMTLSGLTSGIQEFRDTLYELRDRGLGSPKFAIAERCIWRKQIEPLGSECIVHALSPSDAALVASKLQIASLLPQARAAKKRAAALAPNRAAIAMWLSIGDVNILLGSDLQEEGTPALGWAAILASPTRPAGKASVFKVPHHGSKTSHNREIWRQLLNEKPLAIVTPYRRGGTALPNSDDVDRLCSLTPRAYATSEPLRGREIRRDNAVERTIRETVRNIRTVHSRTGHVRLRVRPSVPWQVDLVDGALPLCKTGAV